MTPERWQQLKELLEAAWERDAAGRGAFLDEACAGNPQLRSEVEALLASDENAALFLTGAARGVVEVSEATLARAIGQLPEDSTQSYDLAGTRVGRYTIQGLIGKGGMGAVYRAVREDDFQMQVAIKLLKRGTDTEGALSRFRAERQILAGLQHPNIARLLDGGATEAGLPYFVMEYVDGTPLVEHAAKLSVRQRLELFRSVCQAVHYAHQKLIVHRDIKPANIVVTREGVPKLLDFGIAKLLDPMGGGSATVGTGAGGQLLTPGYASPEQVRGEPVTKATDIYSLGAVLYELLTGRRAHALNTYSKDELEREICTREPPKPSTVAKELDSDLDNIVLMALRKEPERRYTSVQGLSDDIDRFLHDVPVEAREESLAYRARKFLKRNRVPAITAALSAVVVLALVVGWVRFAGLPGGADAGARSIAVLPLENRSGDKEQEYFADGVTDALIDHLAGIPDVRVISRTSSMSFKGMRRPLPEIAKKLGVQTIAEGSVFRFGSRIRIAVRLVDAPRERPMWSSSYEGELGDVLVLQEKVAAAIAGEIGATLNARNRPRTSRHRRVDLAAYDAYLKGRHEYFAAFNQETFERAGAYFRQALELDPGYAPAYAGLADFYYMVSNMYYAPTEAMPKVRVAALKALELDDTLGEAHAVLALVRSVYEYNRSEADKGFKRALELRPNDAQSRLWYSIHLVAMGRFDEAVAEMEHARKLDPVSQATNVYSGVVLWLARRYDQLIQTMQPLADADPNQFLPHTYLAAAYLQKGEFGKAVAEMEKAYELDKVPEVLAQLGHMYAVAGKTADARRVLRQVMELSRERYLSVYDIGVLYAGLGETDEAFRWLQKVDQDRGEFFAVINVDPRLEKLHADPRWAGILRSVGLAK